MGTKTLLPEKTDVRIVIRLKTNPLGNTSITMEPWIGGIHDDDWNLAIIDVPAEHGVSVMRNGAFIRWQHDDGIVQELYCDEVIDERRVAE